MEYNVADINNNILSYMYQQNKITEQSGVNNFNSVLAEKGTVYKKVTSASNVEEYRGCS